MDNMLKSALRWLLYLLSACLIVWAVFPIKSIALGLAAGLAVGAMNAFLLKRRVGMIAEMVIQEGTKRRRGMGFGNRIATVLLLAMFAYQYPETLNMPAALAGSMVMPFLLLAAAIVHTIKENSNGKG